MLGASSAIWVAAAASFAYFIKPEYLKTFHDSTTAREYLCKLFLTAKSDEQRWVVFKKQWSYSRKIRGDIKEWVADRWPKWCEDPPEFFKKELVPIEMRPGSADSGFGL